MTQKAEKKPKSTKKGRDLHYEIARHRLNTLEINQLLTQGSLGESDLRRLKKLFLQDATDRIEENISPLEWQEILEERIVISPSKKELSLIAQMLCLV